LLPQDWLNQLPARLGEGESKDLPLLEGTDAFAALPSWYRPYVVDTLGRYWPRRIRPRLWWRWKVKRRFMGFRPRRPTPAQPEKIAPPPSGGLEP
jgi:hypothetical protein